MTVVLPTQPAPFAPGGNPAAADLQALADWVAFPTMMPLIASVYLGTSTQALPGNGAATVINWANAAVDPGGMFSTSNPGRLTVPVAGRYMFTANLAVASYSANSNYELYVRNQAATIFAESSTLTPASTAMFMALKVQGITPLMAAGNYLQVVMSVGTGVPSGSTVNAETVLQSGNPNSRNGTPSGSSFFTVYWVSAT
jgi:hypothetical protein